MVKVALSEGHEKADATSFGNRLGQAFDFFVMKKIHVLGTDLGEIVFPLDGHGRNFYPVAVFPIASRCRDFTQIDFRIEVRRKGIAVVAAIAVEDIDGIDGIELVFLGVCAICLGNAWVKAAA